jgi:HD-GYP domain-containing protein (c-di-GMP phosphodiesterase class II)
VHLAACALGAALDLEPAARTDLYWASLLHDVGKIGAPDHILKKPGKLTPEEYRVMQEHPVRGDELLAPLSWLGGARRGVRHHHERFDGSGYPDRLTGSAIPLVARIISVADTFDAVISRRSYRDARDAEPAMEVLREAAGTQLDPMVVAAFIERFAEIAAVLSASALPPEGLRSAAAVDPSERRAA